LPWEKAILREGGGVGTRNFTVLTGFRLQEPFVQKGCPRLFSYYPVNGQVLILLVVLDRCFRGLAELAILGQDRKASALIQHELKVFNYRWAALGPEPTFNVGRLSIT
jgi:hypothetical protein